MNPGQIDTDGDQIGNVCDPIQGATFVYLDSESGDYIGQGLTYLFTPEDGGPILASNNVSAGYAEISAGGFSYRFEALQGDPLVVGAYEGATRYPFNDATEPGLSVSGNGRGCNSLTGRFDVLEITRHPDGKLKNFAADFEQHCEGGDPALFGVIRYNFEIAGAGEFDTDNDGVINPADNCDTVPNVDQANFDGDEFGDVCDPFPEDADNLGACLLESEELIERLNELENQVADSDEDGVINGADLCPGTESGANVDSGGCSEAQFCAAIVITPFTEKFCNLARFNRYTLSCEIVDIAGQGRVCRTISSSVSPTK